MWDSILDIKTTLFSLIPADESRFWTESWFLPQRMDLSETSHYTGMQKICVPFDICVHL